VTPIKPKKEILINISNSEKTNIPGAWVKDTKNINSLGYPVIYAGERLGGIPIWPTGPEVEFTFCLNEQTSVPQYESLSSNLEKGDRFVYFGDSIEPIFCEIQSIKALKASGPYRPIQVVAKQLNPDDWQNESNLSTNSLDTLDKSTTILSQTHLGKYVGPTIYFRPLVVDQMNTYGDYDLIRGHLWADKKYLGVASYDPQNAGTWTIETVTSPDGTFFVGLVSALEKQYHLNKTLYASWKPRK
jgi:hypothetical protein